MTPERSDAEPCLTKRHLSYGSLHVGRRAAELNLGAALDCPSYKLGFCQVVKRGQCYCYARKAEKRWTRVLNFHREQGKIWDGLAATELAEQFLRINHRKREPWKELELNDAGDFRSQADVNKAQIIAKILKKEGIFTSSFTARRDLNYENTPDLYLVGSGFIKPGISCEIRAVQREADIPKGYEICLDCWAENGEGCDKCYRGINVWTWIW